MELRVSQLAERAGVSADTLRYYERIGLLPAPQRSAAGYRLYEPQDAERVRFVKRAQRLGLRLDAIADLLRVRDRGLCPCGHTGELLAQRLAELDAELASLARLRDEVAGMLDELPDATGRSWACAGAPVPLTARPPQGATP